MTVSSQTNNVTFVGNGVATSFPLPFRFFSNGDIRAYFIDSTTGASTPMALGTDYTLIGAGEPEVDGNALSLLTTTVPLASLRGLYIERVMGPVQETDIVNQGEFFAATHEDVFDRLTMLVQQSENNSRGAIRVAIGDPEPARLPPAGSRALYMMGFDNLGNPIAVVPETGSAAGLAMDLLNDTDPAKGAALVGRSSIAIDSIADLLLASRSETSRYLVKGYNAGTDFGGGEFYWDAASVAADNGGTIFEVPSVTTGRFIRIYSGNSVDPTWFGAVDGVDSTAALFACHAAGHNVAYPPGRWIHSNINGIPLLEGQRIFGAGGHRFTTGAGLLTRLECSVVGGAFAYYQDLSASVQKSAPHIYDCYVLADYPLRIGDIDTLVTAQGLAMKPVITRNIFQALTPGTGRGLTAVGMFDGDVSGNEFRQFDIQIALIGCDINDIHNNRFSFATSYHILELSAAPSYGSQNKIRNNDILVGEVTGTVFIRSTSHHVRIYDNYLEQGQTRNNVLGFIDTSLQSPPTLGINTGSGIQQSVIVDNNRIDGHNKCTSYLYKINPGAVTTKLWDSGAVGTQDALSAPWLLLSGGEVGLKVRYNVSNFCNWDISGGTGRFTQDFPQFKTRYPGAADGVFEITPEGFASLDHAGLSANNGADYIRLSPKSIAILPAAGTTWIHMLPEQANDVINDLFVTGVSFTVTVVARCTIAGENIYTGRSTGSGSPAGDVSGAMALTTQYKTFTATLTGQAAASVTGLAVRRDNLNAGIVHIKSITVKPA